LEKLRERLHRSPPKRWEGTFGEFQNGKKGGRLAQRKDILPMPKAKPVEHDAEEAFFKGGCIDDPLGGVVDLLLKKAKGRDALLLDGSVQRRQCRRYSKGTKRNTAPHEGYAHPSCLGSEKSKGTH